MRLLQIAVLLLLASTASANEYIMVAKRGVRVRTAPSTTASEIIGITNPGDIFEVYRASSDWYGIIMFSGDIRYIYASLVKPVSKLPAMPEAGIRKKACMEIRDVQDRAVAEAQQQFPIHFDRMIDLARLLTDRYELPVFHQYGISPAHNPALLAECVKSYWSRKLQ